MQPFRLAQISETHLSRARPFFHHNWEVLVAHLNADPPDLVVCTGDMTLDATDRSEDLLFAAAEFRCIAAPALFAPGNHDIGNSHTDVRGGETLITSERRAAFCAAFGDDCWVRDAAPGWRFIGLNSMLPGSGLAAEAEQAALLREAISGAGSRCSSTSRSTSVSRKRRCRAKAPSIPSIAPHWRRSSPVRAARSPC